MKLKLTLLSFVAITLAAVLSAIAINRQNKPDATASDANQVFVVKGIIRGIEAPERTVRLEHEEIPGYMPAMTMPLTVKDPALLTGFNVGDAVQFELVVTEDDSWIAKMEKIDGPVAGQKSFVSKAAESAPVRDVERVQAGETFPDFTLVDQDGKSVRLKDFKGKAVLLTFIYTRCPIPNFCPLMSKNFLDLQQRLQKQFPGKFHLLSVTIDPEFDQPQILQDYGERYTQDFSTWTFATGTREQTDYVANLAGLIRMPENGLISHDLRTALIGPDGKLVHLWKSNVWTPYEVQRRVGEVLKSN